MSALHPEILCLRKTRVTIFSLRLGKSLLRSERIYYTGKSSRVSPEEYEICVLIAFYRPFV